MNFQITFIRWFHQLQVKINRLTERDRFLLLFILIVVLLALWYLLVLNFQLRDLHNKQAKIEQTQTEIAKYDEKKTALIQLINNAEASALLMRHKKLAQDLNKLDLEVNQYNKQYINSHDLAQLMHDMLKQTFGVAIDDFSTVVLPIEQTPAPSPAPPATTQGNEPPKPKLTLSLEPIHYKLVMRGTYFPIMNYLKRLEELPWHLYWSKLDYVVTKYPQAVATMEFYTLKPADVHPIDINKGKNP